MSINKQLKIGNLTAKLPIIQGGMGVGVSRSSLAGAVGKKAELELFRQRRLVMMKKGLRRIRLHVTTEQSTSTSSEQRNSRREMVLSV